MIFWIAHTCLADLNTNSVDDNSILWVPSRSQSLCWAYYVAISAPWWYYSQTVARKCHAWHLYPCHLFPKVHILIKNYSYKYFGSIFGLNINWNYWWNWNSNVGQASQMTQFKLCSMILLALLASPYGFPLSWQWASCISSSPIWMHKVSIRRQTGLLLSETSRREKNFLRCSTKSSLSHWSKLGHMPIPVAVWVKGWSHSDVRFLLSCGLSRTRFESSSQVLKVKNNGGLSKWES